LRLCHRPVLSSFSYHYTVCFDFHHVLLLVLPHTSKEADISCFHILC
jgi:hypothetical protein